MSSFFESLKDSSHSFGWVSIFLHWLSAVLVIILWVIGDGISALEPEQVSERRQLHVSLALAFYLFLLARIMWRLHSKHPHVRGQSVLTHRLAATVHYLLLAGLAGMLCSGPLLAWSSATPIVIFGRFDIQGPAAGIPWIHELASATHGFCGKAVLWLTVIHVVGAFKHLMFHNDETFARMFVPKKTG
jgi:cytochrome b561